MRLQEHLKLDFIKESGVQVLEMPDTEDHQSIVILLPREDIHLEQENHEAFIATATREGSELEDNTYRSWGIKTTVYPLLNAVLMSI